MQDIAYTHRLVFPWSDDLRSLFAEAQKRMLERIAREAQPQPSPCNPHYQLLAEARVAYSDRDDVSYSRKEPYQTLPEREFCFGFVEYIKGHLKYFFLKSHMIEFTRDAMRVPPIRVTIDEKDDSWEDGSLFEYFQISFDLCCPGLEVSRLQEILVQAMNKLGPAPLPSQRLRRAFPGWPSTERPLSDWRELPIQQLVPAT